MGVFSLFLFLLIPFAIITQGMQTSNRRRELFDQFATRSGGLLISGREWYSGLPEIHLEYRGLRMTMKQTSTGGKHPIYYVEAHLDISNFNYRNLRIEVYPERFLGSLGKFLGMQDLLVGDRAFDKKFILKSNEHPSLISFCDPTLRETAFSLARLFGNDDVHIHLDRSRILVKKQQVISQHGQLDQFYGLVLPVFDAALRVCAAESRLESGSSGSDGILFIGETPGQTGRSASLSSQLNQPPVRSRSPNLGVSSQQSRGGEEEIVFLSKKAQATPVTVCPVCGEDLAGRLVVACKSCDGPHHHDCWMFSEGCTVYGCRSKQFVQA